MVKNEFYYPSADGKNQIHAVEWKPESEVKGIIQISHGVTEYIQRYEDFANFFTKKGFVIVGNDHLGHGNSVGQDGKKMYFGPEGSWNYVVKDMNTCKQITKEKYPNIPYIMLGFSLGSFLLRTYLIDYAEEPLNGAIIMGTGNISNLEISIAKFLANKEAKKVGEENTSPMIQSLTFETYNKLFKPNRTPFDWLCSNEEELDKYMNDPQRGENYSAGLFREMLTGMQYTSNIENIKKMNKSLPIYLLSGDNDPVGNFSKGVLKTYKIYKKANMENVKIKFYQNLRHDILHEKTKDKIYDDIYNWCIDLL